MSPQTEERGIGVARCVYLGAAAVPGLLIILVVGMFRNGSVEHTARLPYHVAAPPQVHTPFEDALREARRWRRLAMQEVNREWEALESWDETLTGVDQWPHWRQKMAADPNGHLRRARVHALRAAELARGSTEAYRAAVLLALVECWAGDHAAELRQARKLMALKPRDSLSLLCLQHASECNGL